MPRAHGIERRVAVAHAFQHAARQRQRLQHVERQQAGPQPVVDVVRVVGDVVGDGGALGLDAGEGGEVQVVQFVVVADRLRQGAVQARAGRVRQRAVVLDQPLQRLPGQVQTVELGIAPLQPRHDPQRLCVVVEAAPVRHLLVERILAGMAERRVAEIVDERNGLGQILVDLQSAGQSTRDLRHLDRVGQPRAVMVALMGDKDLCLVFQPAEGGGVDDAVPIALEGRAGRALRLVPQSPA